MSQKISPTAPAVAAVAIVAAFALLRFTLARRSAARFAALLALVLLAGPQLAVPTVEAQALALGCPVVASTSFSADHDDIALGDQFVAWHVGDDEDRDIVVAPLDRLSDPSAHLAVRGKPFRELFGQPLNELPEYMTLKAVDGPHVLFTGTMADSTPQVFLFDALQGRTTRISAPENDADNPSMADGYTAWTQRLSYRDAQGTYEATRIAMYRIADNARFVPSPAGRYDELNPVVGSTHVMYRQNNADNASYLIWYHLESQRHDFVRNTGAFSRYAQSGAHLWWTTSTEQLRARSFGALLAEPRTLNANPVTRYDFRHLVAASEARVAWVEENGGVRAVRVASLNDAAAAPQTLMQGAGNLSHLLAGGDLTVWRTLTSGSFETEITVFDHQTGTQVTIPPLPSAARTSLTLAAPYLAISEETATDRYTLNLRRCEASTPVIAPQITEQPDDLALTFGDDAALRVAATGTAPFSYAWYRGASGDTSQPANISTPEIAVVAPEQPFTLWVRVSNAAGSVDSRAALVVGVPDRAPDQLLLNESFEALTPRGGLVKWPQKNRTGDGRRCNADVDRDGTMDKVWAYDGLCAFVFKGGKAENSILTQTISGAGLNVGPGSILVFEGYFDARATAPNLRVRVNIAYRDGTPASSATVRVAAASGYQRYLASPRLASTAIKHIKVTLTHKTQRGLIVVDVLALNLYAVPVNLRNGGQTLDLPPATELRGN